MQPVHHSLYQAADTELLSLSIQAVRATHPMRGIPYATLVLNIDLSALDYDRGTLGLQRNYVSIGARQGGPVSPRNDEASVNGNLAMALQLENLGIHWMTRPQGYFR